MNMTIRFDSGTFTVIVILISATERLLLDLSPSKSLHQVYYILLLIVGLPECSVRVPPPAAATNSSDAICRSFRLDPSVFSYSHLQKYKVPLITDIAEVKSFISS